MVVLRYTCALTEGEMVDVNLEENKMEVEHRMDIFIFGQEETKQDPQKNGKKKKVVIFQCNF